MPKQYQKTKTMIMVAMLTALEIVFTRFLSFETVGVRIGFGFLPTAVCAMMFGPYAAAAVAFLADFLGVLIYSRGGFYFWGYGISQILYGLSFGFFLYKKEKNIWRIILCILLQEVIVGIFLQSLWLKLAFVPQKGFFAIVISQLPQSLVMAPVKIVMLQFIRKYLGHYMEKHFWGRNS